MAIRNKKVDIDKTNVTRSDRHVKSDDKYVGSKLTTKLRKIKMITNIDIERHKEQLDIILDGVKFYQRRAEKLTSEIMVLKTDISRAFRLHQYLKAFKLFFALRRKGRQLNELLEIIKEGLQWHKQYTDSLIEIAINSQEKVALR